MLYFSAQYNVANYIIFILPPTELQILAILN